MQIRPDRRRRERRKIDTYLPPGLERRGVSHDEELSKSLWDKWKIESALFRVFNPEYGFEDEEEYNDQ